MPPILNLRFLSQTSFDSAAPSGTGVVVHRFEAGPDAFQVSREDGAYRVVGRRIERLAAQTNFDNPESAERFQRDLQKLGVERELVKAGVNTGDTVKIGKVELEWDSDA